jgi:hypothetical protein
VRAFWPKRKFVLAITLISDTHTFSRARDNSA